MTRPIDFKISRESGWLTSIDITLKLIFYAPLLFIRFVRFHVVGALVFISVAAFRITVWPFIMIVTVALGLLGYLSADAPVKPVT